MSKRVIRDNLIKSIGKVVIMVCKTWISMYKRGDGVSASNETVSNAILVHLVSNKLVPISDLFFITSLYAPAEPATYIAVG